jgi:secondary thiamine-phosphate synthase enzyme
MMAWRRVESSLTSGDYGGMVETTRHQIATSGQGDVQDMTDLVARVLGKSSLKDGLLTVAVVGSTAGVTTIEFEPGAVADLNKVWEQLAPRNGEYKHHLQWGDDNGSSHVRAAMLGPSISIPFEGGNLCVGTWQQIVLIEFDTRGRHREVVIQLIG